MQHKLAAYKYHIYRTHTLPPLEQNKHSEMNTNKQLKTMVFPQNSIKQVNRIILHKTHQQQNNSEIKHKKN
jgi:hypothetical protein